MKKHLPLFISILLSLNISAQQDPIQQDSTLQDSTQFEQVRSLLNFYQYMLNAVGSEKSSTRDKEVIIGESYKKIFEYNEVQIEDDLLEGRSVITNKDVNAYLRDVDFFFKDISFDFRNEQIEKVYKEDSGGYFLVSFESAIEGTTLEGNPYSRSQPRFMEVNYDSQSEDLKIASIYSTKVSREVELRNWWADLSLGWKSALKKYVPFDSLSVETLELIANIDSIGLNDPLTFDDLTPLLALKNLQVLDISNTQVSDLEPLRHTKNLRKLIARQTNLISLNGLQYLEQLTTLDLASSTVVDISAIAALQSLKYLNLSNTSIVSFESLRSLSGLDSIDLSQTTFSDLSSLEGNAGLKTLRLKNTSLTSTAGLSALTDLEYLDLSYSNITSLEGLQKHPSLKKLFINGTNINDLSSLEQANKLRKIYADFSQVTEETASRHMAEYPKVLVVTNSEEIRKWWSNLPSAWITHFEIAYGLTAPSNEELIKFLNIDSLNLSAGNLKEPTPLKKFKRLKYLNVDKNLFRSFDFTSEMKDLEVLKAANIPTESSSGLEKNPKLRKLLLSGSPLNSLEGLEKLSLLEVLEIDNTLVDEKQISFLLEENPDLTIIFQTTKLLKWWESLDANWKEALKIKAPDSYSLHSLIEQTEISLSNQAITSLEPLLIFLNLKQLTIDNLRITSLAGISAHNNLESLTIINGPLQSLDSIGNLKALTSLNVKNTAIETLRPLHGMTSIRSLNCSGTNIKNLKGIEQFYDLAFIDFSNTRVWKLQRLYGMSDLKKIVCFNTRLREHTIEEFKKAFPSCEIDFY
ncbi:MAG: hypothetical protein HRT61_08565 [Ekhidna sp.]|nr:hypothetical protein [Ekhidna sp.]